MHKTPEPSQSRRGSTPTQRWTLALSALASFVVVLDMLVVATALTAIQRDLDATLSDLEWTVNAYTLSFAVLLLTGAALGDRYGRRRMFAVGLGLFASASAACALAPGIGALVAARSVQGAGAAMIMPVALSVLNAAFPPERRGWATGIYGSVTALAAILGPVLGGSIAQGLAWPWIFWINVPIGLVAIPFVLTRIPESRGPATGLDLPGLVLAAGAAMGLTWALIRGNPAGWASGETTVTLATGGVLLVAFVVWSSRARAPMLPLRLFRARAFAAGNAAIFLLNAALTGAIFFTAQYIQVAQGHGPLEAGLRLLPWGVIPVLVAPRAGSLADRVGERALSVCGAVLLALGMGGLALAADADATYLGLLAAMASSGLGLALAIPAVTRAVVSRSASSDIGKASGTFSTLRQLGGAFGVAIVGASFAARGGYGSASSFSDGFVAAMAVAAVLAMIGAAAAAALPRLVGTGRPPAPAQVTATQRTAPRVTTTD